MKSFKQFFNEEADVSSADYYNRLTHNQRDKLAGGQFQNYKIAKIFDSGRLLIYTPLPDGELDGWVIDHDGDVIWTGVGPDPKVIERWKKEDLQKKYGNDTGETLADL